MIDTQQAVALKARYVFPIDGEPIVDGVVTLEAGKVVAVGENSSNEVPRDLGNVALLPGLVNAHTHLEFSLLPEPIGDSGMVLPDWIHEVISYRRVRNTKAETSHQSAIESGLKECQQLGTIGIGEIATQPWTYDVGSDTSCDTTVFLELIGRTDEQVATLIDDARKHIVAGKESGTRWHPGLSPHAPYSVCPDLVQKACSLSREFQIPVAMHLAESLEELELLASGSGPFQELLRELGAWDPTAIPRGIRPLDYLEMLSTAHRSLVIHGNFLSADEIEFIGQKNDRMSVVYCPRTHQFFKHGRYPLAEMMAAGVQVALGTDSRASNPDLNLFAEMRHVANTYDDVQLARVLEMGTINGARALGVDEQLGTITVGKRAEFVSVRLPSSGDGDPYEMLLRATEVELTPVDL